MRVRSLFAIVPLAVAACSDPSGPSPGTPRITALPRALSAGEEVVIRASNTFGFNLLGELNRTRAGENIFMSPLSASMALGMAMNGAEGTTFEGMRTALGFGTEPSSEITASYKSLIALLRGLDPAVDFRIANSIWYRLGFPVEQSFLDEATEYFDATVTGLDFSAPTAAPTINDWVKQRTSGRIEEIVESPIDADVVMYLINAIYFNGAWTTRFDKGRTRPEPFTTLAGATTSVPTMYVKDTVRVAERPDFRVIDLPYGGGAFAMTILLPRGAKTVNDVVASLTPQVWNDAVTIPAASEVELYLPKFTLRWEAELNDPLIALGMHQAFSAGLADFSRMSRPLGTRLYISKVKQKSFVDVHEEGTEAAAVTSVEVRVVCACGPQVIRVDRPFLFAIRERLSGTIVFVGKIVEL